MAHSLKELSSSDMDWMRQTATGNEYWSLYWFCKVILGYVDLTPSVHLLYCEFLDDERNHYKLAMMPRDFVKSWILRGKAIRDYLRDNNVRILLAMATEDLARNASEQMAGIVSRNQFIRSLWPENVPNDQSSDRNDRWTTKARTLPRTIEAPEATFSFAGVKTELVSGHYDKIFLDDVFGKEAADSQEVANKVFTFHAACEPLLNDPKTSEIIQACTRWSMDDLAARIMGEKKQQTEELVFRGEGDARYVCLKRAAIEDGMAIWPERFDLQALADKEAGFEAQRLGHFFAFQYLNNPIDERVVEFPKPRYWERLESGKIGLIQPDGTRKEIDERELYITLTIDPAYTGKKRADDSAICVIGSHPEGYRVNLLSIVMRAELSVFVDRLISVISSAYARGLPIAKVGMETNAQQLATQQYIKEIAKQRGVYIPWSPIKCGPLLSKEHRIRQMIPVVADGFYYTHKDFHQANQEMRVFPASRKDNWLDAFAYQPQLWGIAGRQPISDEDERTPWPLDEERESRTTTYEGYGG